MASNNSKTIGVTVTLCGAAAIGVARMFWDGPTGAKAAPAHAGGVTAQHRGNGGTGDVHRFPPYTPIPTTDPAGIPFNPQPATPPATTPGAAAPSTTDGAATAPATIPTTAPTTAPATAPASGSPSIFEQDRLTGDWLGRRTRMQNAGLNIDASIITTTGKTLSGGVNTADSAWGYRFSLGITADLEKLLDIKGGTAFLNFRSMDGKRDSLDGAFQVTSLEYSPLRNQISELWYSQKLLNDQLLVKAGKIDANNDFAFVANASEFANSSMCNSLTILGMPTNPDPAMGTDLFFHPTSNLYAGAGMFDGSLEQGISTGSRGPSTLFEHSLFFIGEFGTTWSTSAHQDGRLGIGAWGHTGQFARYSGGTDDGTAGAYLVLDQTIWRKHPEIDGDTQGVFAYLQYGYADPQVSPVQDHFGAGATWVGLMDWRKNDILGLAATYVEFTNVRSAGYSGGGELDVELFYKVVVTPWLSIKPDIQFVRNPGGVRDRPDALAASIQTTVTF